MRLWYFGFFEFISHCRKYRSALRKGVCSNQLISTPPNGCFCTGPLKLNGLLEEYFFLLLNSKDFEYGNLCHHGVLTFVND